MTIKIIRNDCQSAMRGMKPNSVDLVFGSPPYAGKGERYIGGRKKWGVEDWVEWMYGVTLQACNISKGYVIWVANGFVRDGIYHPACELLMARIYNESLKVVNDRPNIWHKNAPPNRKDFFGNDWEYVLFFRHADKKPFFDWEAVAEEAKYKSGGDFRQRSTNGERRKGSSYPKNKLARPRDVFRCTVGGGHMGHALAHENEAPFPIKLPDRYIRACCPLGGTVLDPFFGSGTTGQAANECGRDCIGIDVRESQVELSTRRLSEVSP